MAPATPMTDTSWRELGSVFDQVFDLPAEQRKLRLDELCADDQALRSEVESLLRAHQLAEHFTHAGFTVTVGALGNDALSLAPARQLGPYTLLRELGRGGMSTVFLAARADDEFDRLVAIKTLRPAGGFEGYERFRAERQVHANLEHPGIARLYGGGTTDGGVPYIVMEYIEDGLPISAYCDRQGLDAGARVSLFRSVLAAVAYAHRNLVVHRDIKPSNILVAPDGTAKLLDFGISKLLTREGSDWDPTGIGPGPLTPSYASPEQILGEPITTASDVFSLGALLFRMLAGTLPYPGSLGERLRALKDDDEPTTLARAAVGEDSEPASALTFLALERGRRSDLEAIVAKALERRPAQRYGSVELFDEDLHRWQSGLTVSARPPTLAYRCSRWLRRNWLTASFAATVATTLLASSIFLALQAGELARERDRARDEVAKSEQILELLLGFFEGSDPARVQGAEVSVRDVLLAAEPQIDRELGDQPRVQAALFEAVGRVFYNLGSLDDAERILERARELWRSAAGPDAAAGADTLDLLAGVQINRGGLEQALELHERGRELRRAAHGAGSLEEAKSWIEVGHAQLLLNRLPAAETSVRRALAAFREHGDAGYEEHRIEARYLLARVHLRQDRPDLAEPLYHQVLADAREHLGRYHPDTLTYLVALASLKARQEGQLEAAERYTREAVAAFRQVYDQQDHPNLAASLGLLWDVLAKKGDLDGALAAIEEGIAMQQRLLGEESLMLAIYLGDLGWFHLFRRGDPESAEPILRRALAMAEKYLPAESPALTYPLIGLGRCRVLAGEPAQGQPYLERALAIRRAVSDAEAPRVARAELFLGESLAAQGRCGEAEGLLAHAEEVLEPGGDADDLSRMQEPLRVFREVCGGEPGGRDAG